MAMNVGSGEGEDEAISAINTTPLVDVMLVLLIIFLVTIPVITHSVNLQLPKEQNVARQTKPENIEIAVTKDGDVFWGLQKVADNEDLVNRLKKIAVIQPQPEVHIRGDLAGRYEFVGRVVFACQRAGIQKIGFVTEPPPPTEKPVVVTIDVDFDGTVFWNGDKVNDRADLETRLTGAAAAAVQPEVHLRPNKLAEYKDVAAVMASAQRLGVTKLGLVGNEQFVR